MASCCGKPPSPKLSNLPLSCGNIKCAPPKILNCNNGLQQLSRSLALAIVIKNTWNVPGCGEIATLYVHNLSNAPVGSFLWSADYGYFEIVGFDNTTGKLQVTNACFQGEQNLGKTVPKCSLMILVSAPGILTSGTNVFLTSDFVAPSIDVCVTVSVTSSLFLTEGGNILVGDATYFLDEIIDDTTILICNKGGGFTLGTFVRAFNSAGEFQYSISNIGAAAINQDIEVVTGNLTFGGLSTLSAAASLSLQNTSDVSEMLVYWTSIATFKGEIPDQDVATDNLKLRIDTIVPSGTETRQLQIRNRTFSAAEWPFGSQLVATGVFVLAPMQGHNLQSTGTATRAADALGVTVNDLEITETLTTFQKYV